MITASATKRPCRKCSAEARPSRSQGFEVVLRFLGMGHYRCLACQQRFLAVRGWGERQWQMIYGAGCVGLVLAVVWFGLKFMGQGGGTPPQ